MLVGRLIREYLPLLPPTNENPFQWNHPAMEKERKKECKKTRLSPPRLSHTSPLLTQEQLRHRRRNLRLHPSRRRRKRRNRRRAPGHRRPHHQPHHPRQNPREHQTHRRRRSPGRQRRQRPDLPNHPRLPLNRQRPRPDREARRVLRQPLPQRQRRLRRGRVSISWKRGFQYSC